MTELTDEAVKALLDGTTEGPWEAFIDDSGGQWTGWPLSIDAPAIADKTVVRTGGQWPYEWDAKTSQDEACQNARLIAAAPDLARALLDARAENDRLRADAQAAVALVLEQAVMDLPKAVGAAATKWCGEKDRETFQSDIEYFRTNWRDLPGLRDYVLRALAPADSLAAVEALRKERDLAVAQNDRLWAANHNLVAEQDALTAEIAAAQQREARRTFPILKGDGAKIDYQLVADHAEQARSNHGQSVDRLAARGGLSWCELYAVLHNRKWEKVDTNEAMIACRSLEARYLAALSNNGRGE